MTDTGPPRDSGNALDEALTAPGAASMVDALLALSGASPSGPLSRGMEAALSAKMRSVIDGRTRRRAA